MYQSTKIVPLGITELSPYEIQEAYEEAGVTYDSIVGKTERHFDEKVNKVEEIVTAFMDLEANIQVGVNEALAQDASLARKVDTSQVVIAYTGTDCQSINTDSNLSRKLKKTGTNFRRWVAFMLDYK